MSDANPYALLFEPVQIGPVTARNRFYQVPHCTGLGHVRPRADAAVRGHEGRRRLGGGFQSGDRDSPDLGLVSLCRGAAMGWARCARVAADDGCSTCAWGAGSHPAGAQWQSRAEPADPRSGSCTFRDVHRYAHPKQAQAMDKADIREFRRWHREAALRAKDAGFDIIYVYAGHNMTLAQHFMLPHMNQRSDEYGGSLENRVRLTRELLEDTHEAVGDSCAVALRFAIDEMVGADGHAGFRRRPRRGRAFGRSS